MAEGGGGTTGSVRTLAFTTCLTELVGNDPGSRTPACGEERDVATRFKRASAHMSARLRTPFVILMGEPDSPPVHRVHGLADNEGLQHYRRDRV